MTPDAKDCETARLNVEVVPTHHGRRILPGGPEPAVAWTENEDERPADNTNSPGESRRLLPSQPPPKHKSRLQAGLTLGVQPTGKYLKCPQISIEKKKAISKFEKKKQNLIALLKPPYFILSVIIVIICVHIWVTDDIRASLEWSPAAWWQEPWRVFTYGLVHANVPHLTLNALVALAVGWPLEREQRWFRILWIWCGGIVAGALGAGVMQPNVRVVGASAAVYALLTSHLANVCLRYGHVPLWWFRPLSVLVLGTSELCWALIRELPLEEDGHATAHTATTREYVAWSAHIVGAAVGVPLAFIVFTGENYKKTSMVVCRMISLLILITTIVITAIHYTFEEAVEPIPWYLKSNQT